MAGTLYVRPLLIAPSILSADPLALGASVDSLKGDFDWLHLDIMDGHFVPNLSYGPAVVRALRRRYPDAVLDVHVMAEHGEDFIDMFIEAKPDYLTVHQEACRHLHRVLSRIRSAGIKAGVALNPATPVCLIEPVLHMADLVLLMSVNPGFGGQQFIPEVLDKSVQLCRLREARGCSFLIEMDGGIGEKNIALVRKNGVDAAVMGSAVFGAPDPAAAVKKMRLLAENI
jgi:ribulose-phosphate 3-epimerase